MMSRVCVALAVLGVVAAGCGRATIEVVLEEEFTVEGDLVVDVLLPRGDITVETHEGEEVLVSATASLAGGSEDERAAFAAAPPLRITQDGTGVRVRFDLRAEARGEATIDLRLVLPVVCDLELHTGRGDITVHGVHGTVSVASERGDIELRDLEATLTATTGRGIVIAHGQLLAGEHTVRSSGGRIELWLRHDTCARILAETTKGKIEDSNLLVRGARQPKAWDVSTYCSSGGGFQVSDDPPATIHLLADPGNIYLLTWYDEED
ncbi:MAG: DUF4097 family beta strand repeat protein [Candidatus Bipolaricaulota bacterium]|nr:MAG: DUF4097 family beta strand repeat protein [Candidatus Bipolaricaulota bacterium]